MRIPEERCRSITITEEPLRDIAELIKSTTVIRQIIELNPRVTDRSPHNGQEVVDEIGPLQNVQSTSRCQHRIETLQGSHPQLSILSRYFSIDQCEPLMPRSVIVNSDELFQVRFELASCQKRTIAKEDRFIINDSQLTNITTALRDVAALMSVNLLQTTLQSLMPPFNESIISRLLTA